MTVKPLPKWAMRKYAQLWGRFKSREFDYISASAVLNEKNPNLVSVLMTYLKKFSWIEVRLHPKDSRKRIYTLKNPEKAVQEMEK